MNRADNTFLVKEIENNKNLKMYQIFSKTFVSSLKPFEIGLSKFQTKKRTLEGVLFFLIPHLNTEPIKIKQFLSPHSINKTQVFFFLRKYKVFP
jgi:hypothetical protein